VSAACENKIGRFNDFINRERSERDEKLRFFAINILTTSSMASEKENLDTFCNFIKRERSQRGGGGNEIFYNLINRERKRARRKIQEFTILLIVRQESEMKKLMYFARECIGMAKRKIEAFRYLSAGSEKENLDIFAILSIASAEEKLKYFPILSIASSEREKK